jgi:hypothetical protein
VAAQEMAAAAVDKVVTPTHPPSGSNPTETCVEVACYGDEKEFGRDLL